MSFKSSLARLLTRDSGQQPIANVAILAVGATVLVGVQQLGSQVVHLTEDQTNRVLNGGGESQSVAFATASAASSSKTKASARTSDNVSEIPSESNETSLSQEANNATYSQTARALRSFMSADTAAPSNGSVPTTPVDPIIDPKPVPVPAPVEPTEPNGEAPVGTDPSVNPPNTAPKKGTTVRRTKKKKSEDEEPAEEELDNESGDEKTHAASSAANQQLTGSDNGSSSGLRVGGSGGFNPSGFPGSNPMMGNSSNGFPQGMPNPYANNFSGNGGFGNSFPQAGSSNPTSLPSLPPDNRIDDQRSDREPSEVDAEQSIDSGDRSVRQSRQRKQNQKPVQEESTTNPVPQNEISNLIDGAMKGSISLNLEDEHPKKSSVILTQQGAIEIKGVDRSDKALPRLKIVCHKPFRQIHVKRDDRQLAFNAPQPEQLRSIPLEPEMLQPGGDLLILGIESESAEQLTYTVPLEDIEPADALDAVPAPEIATPLQDSDMPMSPVADPAFAGYLELAEQ